MLFRVFRVFPWLIIKIRIIGLIPHACQFPSALFVRRLACYSLRIGTGMDSLLFRVFRVFPWLIIKISIMELTPHARQLPGALFVRRLRFRLVKNRNRKMDSCFSVCSVFFRG